MKKEIAQKTISMLAYTLGYSDVSVLSGDLFDRYAFVIGGKRFEVTLSFDNGEIPDEDVISLLNSLATKAWRKKISLRGILSGLRAGFRLK
jgi:hypothetical protein